jgi:D-aminoacyl-tRNA deacylase
VQRVSRAQVAVDGETAGEIGPGLCVLLGIERGDTPTQAARLAEKVARLRIFENAGGKFDRSLLDEGGAALVISQFTLIADSKRQKGTRPDFSGAAPKEQAEPLYEHFSQALRDLGVPVATGNFGARMSVELVNDGPVTIIIDIGSSG